VVSQARAQVDRALLWSTLQHSTGKWFWFKRWLIKPGATQYTHLLSILQRRPASHITPHDKSWVKSSKTSQAC
jgi:hypothetical protein